MMLECETRDKRGDIYVYEYVYVYINMYGKPYPHRERRNSRKCNSPGPIPGTAGPLGPLD